MGEEAGGKMTAKTSLSRAISNPVFLLACRLFLAYVFIYAGVSKIVDPKSFAAELLNYRVFPDVFINIISLGLPPLEFLCGIAIIAGPFIREAATWLILLILGFGGGMVSTMIRGISLDCGCGLPGGPTPVSWFTLVRDLVFLIAAVAVFLYPQKQMKITIKARPESKELSFHL
jgi:putative oxidoreductase